MNPLTRELIGVCLFLVAMVWTFVAWCEEMDLARQDRMCPDCRDLVRKGHKGGVTCHVVDDGRDH